MEVWEGGWAAGEMVLGWAEGLGVVAMEVVLDVAEMAAGSLAEAADAAGRWSAAVPPLVWWMNPARAPRR